MLEVCSVRTYDKEKAPGESALAPVPVVEAPGASLARVLLKVVCADASLEEHLRGLLDRSGIGSETLVSSDPITVARDNIQLIVSVLIGEGEPCQDHAISAEAARLSGLPWLHVTSTRDNLLLIGPVFGYGCTPCYRCFQGGLSIAAVAAGAPSSLTSVSIVAIAAAVTLEIVNQLSSPENFHGARTINAYDLERHASNYLIIARQPGCPCCWPWLDSTRRLLSDKMLRISSLYEECARVQIEPDLVQGKTCDGVSGDPSTLKEFPNCSKVFLEPWSTLYRKAYWEPLEEPQQRKSLSQSDISNLLFVAFGRFDAYPSTRPDRSLPSAGNLGSAEAFLVVRDVAGLETGIYFYESHHHCLALLDTPQSIPSEQFIAESGAPSRDGLLPAALIITSGAFGRISAKYGAFGFRLIHFDAGVCLGRLTATARALHVTISDLPGWNDELLQKHLVLQSSAEPVVCVLALYAQGTAHPRADHHDHLLREAKAGIHNTPQPLLVSNPMSLARTIYEASLLPVYRPAPDEHHLPLPDAGPVYQGAAGLRASGSSLGDLWTDTVRRRSQRRFARTRIEINTVERILEGAIDRASCSDSDLDVTTDIFVSLALDDEPERTFGVFSYDRKQHCLHRRSAIPAGADMSSMFVDDWCSNAPAVFWVCGDVGCQPRQYRRLLVEAGRQVYHLTAAAQDHGVGGVIVAGIRATMAAKLLHLNHVEETTLIAFIAGH